MVLAIKPQKLGEVAAELRRHVSPGTIVLSILAGVEIATLKGYFPEAGGIMRAMPNLPVAVRRGVTGLSAKQAIGA